MHCSLLLFSAMKFLAGLGDFNSAELLLLSPNPGLLTAGVTAERLAALSLTLLVSSILSRSMRSLLPLSWIIFVKTLAHLKRLPSVRIPTIGNIAPAPLNLCRALTPGSQTNSLNATLASGREPYHYLTSPLLIMRKLANSLCPLDLVHEVVKLHDG